MLQSQGSMLYYSLDQEPTCHSTGQGGRVYTPPSQPDRCRYCKCQGGIPASCLQCR